MCNRLHEDSTPIAETGTGYKLFRQSDEMVFPLISDTINYKVDEDGWVRWNNKFEEEGDGFCFFLTREEAKRALALWSLVSRRTCEVVRQIRYGGGLGKHAETGFITNCLFVVGLCKEFTVLEDDRKGEESK